MLKVRLSFGVLLLGFLIMQTGCLSLLPFRGHGFHVYDVEGTIYKAPSIDFKSKSIAILDFDSAVHWAGGNDLLVRSDGKWAADMINTELLFSGFNVLERRDLPGVAEERRAASLGLTQEGKPGTSFQELGRLLGADLLMVGSVTFFGYEMRSGTAVVGLSARIVDVSTGKVCWSFSGSHRALSLQHAMYSVCLAIERSLIEERIYTWQKEES
jgi:curli biogenesis system outer membrane secretion channel CsgG